MIELNNVSKRYKANNALTNVSLTIEPNDMVLFIGENGSGKSTCLKLINNIIFLSRLDQGQITNTFKGVSYLPEKLSLPTLITSKDYLKIYKELYNLDTDIERKMNEYKVPNKLISNMSKGMKQKVGIIISLMTPASLYIFDEPTDGLDIESKEHFVKDIKELISNGKTILISTHNKDYFKGLKAKTFTFEGGVLCKKIAKPKKEN